MRLLRMCFMFSVATCLMLVMPVNSYGMADYNQQKLSYSHGYPLPHVKPINSSACSAKARINDKKDIHQKQAVAAALGLYLGLGKIVSPPKEAALSATCNA